MEYLALTREDEELIGAAASVIRRNYVPGRHHVGAAVRASSGQIYTGVHLESRVHDVCAEPVALGAAASNGEREVDAIVAVMGESEGAGILSPCGTCRELITFTNPEMLVILTVDGEVRKCRARDLLPGPYVNSGKG